MWGAVTALRAFGTLGSVSPPSTEPWLRPQSPNGPGRRVFTSAPALLSDADERPQGAGNVDPDAVEGYVEIPVDQLKFDDPTAAYKAKTTWEVVRATAIFELCSFKFIIDHAATLVQWSRWLLGDDVTGWIVKKTFFAHFCAGENADEIVPTISRLEQSGVRAILDFAAEADVDEVQSKGGKQGAKGGDDPFEAEEALCDMHAEIFKSAILAASRQTYGFAAIKLTGLGRPELLLHMSNILVKVRTLFATFAERSSQETGTTDVFGDSVINLEDFEAGIKKLGLAIPDVPAEFARFDANETGYIDYLEWIDSLDPMMLGRRAAAEWIKSEGLSQDQFKQLTRMFERLSSIVDLADKTGVTLMVDAEYTYTQPAIDHIVLHLQRKFNRGRYPIVYNTYQAYLKDCHSRVQLDIRRSAREGFWFGAKLVRGAYMVTERKRAKKMGYPDPIHDTINDTHACFHKSLDSIIDNIDHAEVLVASHNETSVRYAAKRMEELGIKRRDGGVFFGQLLGMCDHVTFTLGANGFSVYKYVPYGPWHEVMPYLLRRAVENSAMLGGESAIKERTMWAKEARHRIFGRGGSKQE